MAFPSGAHWGPGRAVVKRFNDKSGWGYLTCEDGTDVWFIREHSTWLFQVGEPVIYMSVDARHDGKLRANQTRAVADLVQSGTNLDSVVPGTSQAYAAMGPNVPTGWHADWHAGPANGSGKGVRGVADPVEAMLLQQMQQDAPAAAMAGGGASASATQDPIEAMLYQQMQDERQGSATAAVTAAGAPAASALVPTQDPVEAQLYQQMQQERQGSTVMVTAAGPVAAASPPQDDIEAILLKQMEDERNATSASAAVALASGSVGNSHSTGAGVNKELAFVAKPPPAVPAGPITPGPGNYTGVVKTFNNQSGWGFITMPAGNDIWFIRESSPGWHIQIGEHVKFDLIDVRDDGKLRARGVCPAQPVYQGPTNFSAVGNKALVKRFNPASGWGFITTEDGTDVWFIRDDCYDRGFLAAPGTQVLYDAVKPDESRNGKLRAIGVRLIDYGTAPPPQIMNPMKRPAPDSFGPGSFASNSFGPAVMPVPKIRKLATDPSAQFA